MSSIRRIVIVGGVAGGASAATRARRLSEQVEIVLFERGLYVSFANCGLPYYISGAISNRERLLVQTPEGLAARYRIDVRVRTDVLSIDRAAREIVASDMATGATYRFSYDALVLSPGAEPIRPPIPGAGDPLVFTLRSVPDMDAIEAAVTSAKNRRALVVGAGYIGLEMTEAFRLRGLDVTVVEKLDHVMGVADPEMVAPIHDELARHGIDLRLGESVATLERKGDDLEALLSGGERIRCGLVLLAVGVRPETKLAKAAGLELGVTGGIVVDDRMRTSDPRIWAVGDAVEVKHLVSDEPALIPLAGPANRQGRIAADNILGLESRYSGTQGTAICKVFDLAFGTTGLSETGLARAGRRFSLVYLHPPDHAAYYPGAHPISLKILFDPDTGRILGAQAVGVSGVDKRIDVLAVAIRAGMTVSDLEDLELCYAPPFGSAKDPVNMAGFVASGALHGPAGFWEPAELAQPHADRFLLDVRTAAEHERGTIPGAVCIPVDELRERITDLPREKELLVFCQVGLRGYVAARMLLQNGFRVRNLSGGFKRYLMWRGDLPESLAAEAEITTEE